MSSSFQQNWFHVIWTSFAKDISFPVCEIEVDPFPFGVYNILLNYDVSLHNLVVLIVTIPTSPRLSKTQFICKSYGVLFSLFGSGPEMVRSLRPSGPESPVCPDNPMSPQHGRNLRPRPESLVHLHRSLRSEQAATASFFRGPIKHPLFPQIS